MVEAAGRPAIYSTAHPAQGTTVPGVRKLARQGFAGLSYDKAQDHCGRRGTRVTLGLGGQTSPSTLPPLAVLWAFLLSFTEGDNSNAHVVQKSPEETRNRKSRATQDLPMEPQVAKSFLAHPQLVSSLV